jgi:hypothetical protein
MKNRSPIAVALLPFVTLGIYGIYWQVKTKGEMNAVGANIPTAWLIIVPLVNIWWLWKYSEGVDQATGHKLSGVLAFILLWLLGPIGAAIVQDSFNNNVAAVPSAGAPVAPVAAESSPTATPPSDVPSTGTVG